jgi:hypothetical protein
MCTIQGGSFGGGYNDEFSQNSFVKQRHLEHMMNAMRSGLNPKRAVEMTVEELLHWNIDNGTPMPREERDIEATRDYKNWEFVPRKT